MAHLVFFLLPKEVGEEGQAMIPFKDASKEHHRTLDRVVFDKKGNLLRRIPANGLNAFYEKKKIF